MCRELVNRCSTSCYTREPWRNISDDGDLTLTKNLVRVPSVEWYKFVCFVFFCRDEPILYMSYHTSWQVEDPSNRLVLHDGNTSCGMCGQSEDTEEHLFLRCEPLGPWSGVESRSREVPQNQPGGLQNPEHDTNLATCKAYERCHSISRGNLSGFPSRVTECTLSVLDWSKPGVHTSPVTGGSVERCTVGNWHHLLVLYCTCLASVTRTFNWHSRKTNSDKNVKQCVNTKMSEDRRVLNRKVITSVVNLAMRWTLERTQRFS